MNREPKPLRRAVILAAGTSRRLQNLRLSKPKPMVEIGGKPLLTYHLERCAGLGIEEVFINLHYLPEQIQKFAGDGSRWGLKVRYNFESSLSGTAGGVKGFAQQLRDAPFLVIYGDNFLDFGLQEIVRAHFGASPRAEMSVVLFHLDDVSSSGVAVCRADGTIETFLEKPKDTSNIGHWVNSGVYLMEPELLNLIPDGFSDFGHDFIPLCLAGGKRILGVKTLGRVFAIDTPDLLDRVSMRFSSR